MVAKKFPNPPNDDPGNGPGDDPTEINLLLNPGFEELEDGVPVGWNGYVRKTEGSGFSSSPITVSAEAAYSGNVGVELKGIASYIQQTVNVADYRGQTLEITAWQKGNGSGQIKFEYVCFNPETEKDITCREEDPGFTATPDWEQVSFTTDVAEEIERDGGLIVKPHSVRVLVRLTDTASIYYDDLSFHPAE